MAITITQRPEQTIYGMDSDWNGVGNPVIYKATTDQYTQDNYYLEVYVYDETDTALNSEALAFTPNSNGQLTIDITSVLRAQLLADNDIDLTNTNIEMHDDVNVYQRFYIKYKEVWTGSSNSLISDGGNQFFAVLGARQIPSTYGGNYFEYTVFSSVDYSDAKFLTKLSKPVWWRGYPFVLSAIIDDSLTTTALDLKVVADSTQYAGQQLSKSGKMVGCYFGFVGLGVIDGSDSATVSIVDFATKAITYTEQLEVELRDACQNPIMLMARNSLGGVLQWVFEVDQEYTFDYGNDIKAARKVLKANNLTTNQWEALQDFITLGPVYRNNITEFTSSTIKTSSRVGQQVYVVTAAGVKTGVIVIPTRNTTQTKRVNHNFEIEIEYPEIF